MKSLAFVLMVVFEIVLMLCIYPLMFSINYFAWKSMLGEEPAISA